MDTKGFRELKFTSDHSEGPVRDMKSLETAPSIANLEFARRNLIPTDDESAQHLDTAVLFFARSLGDPDFRRFIEIQEETEDQNGKH